VDAAVISLRQIRYALAVEKTLHFKKAAELCSISQSALSTALAEMEKQLGFQVFERDNKKVLVTPQGREVLDKARIIKREMDDLSRLSATGHGVLSSPMSIGMIPTIAPYLLPTILPALEREHPSLGLEVSEGQSLKLLDQVRSGDIDAAILALPFDIDGLLAFRFWRENFYWVTHADDRLARVKRIRARDIDSSELMLLEEGHCLKEQALAVCKLSGTSIHDLGATSLPTLVQLVAGRMGSTLVPEMAVESLVDNNPALRKVPLAEAGPHREIAFIVRPTYPRVADIEALCKLFARELRRKTGRKAA
jgi:LysR family transcriptional regulator, hydrogen peroxide-inducible genes activator